jgi:hypothetical protein
MKDQNTKMRIAKPIRRWIHFFSFLFVLVLGCVLCAYWPTMLKDSPTALSTIGTFVTIWGVMVAIAELIRLESAADASRQAAQRVFNEISRIDKVSQITQCEHLIKAANDCVDEKRHIPIAVIGQIITLYSGLFSAELSNNTSVHRFNRSMLVAYTIPGAASQNNMYKPPKRTTGALLSILGQLSELKTHSTSFEELTL